MCGEYKELNFHQRLEMVIEDMVDQEIPIREATKEFERIYLAQANRKYNGKKAKVAKALGVHRNTLRNMLNRLD
ncbi:MAG: helix-turn-helix domain-containing protein [Acidobacteriota bacterium]